MPLSPEYDNLTPVQTIKKAADKVITQQEKVIDLQRQIIDQLKRENELLREKCELLSQLGGDH